MPFVFSVFLGAFLLFQIQPLVAKIILPVFGGGAAVWTGCLLFFQFFLLLGYLYAHVLARYFDFKKQLLIHVGFVVISLFALPIGIDLASVSQSSPLIGILSLLTLHIGLPYLLLSATGPLLQRWLSVIDEEKIPFKLYALSNVASMVALLSFPFIFEAYFTQHQQTIAWSIGYLAYVVAMTLLIIWLYRRKLAGINNSRFVVLEKSDWSISFLWLMLSAVGVVLLVATTNAMTQNVPPVPFLWILPLSLYLLTFVICFHHHRWYVRSFWFILFSLCALVALLMYFIGSQFDIVMQVSMYSLILFSGCMVCHGELLRHKPHHQHLTWFYLVMAFGGFAGSAFVAFIAVNLFTQYTEYPLSVIAVLLLFSWSIAREQYGKAFKMPAYASAGYAVVLIGLFVMLNQQYVKTNVMSERNFYGIISVKDVINDPFNERRLIDGTTSHGTQSLDKTQDNTPLSYYREQTGVALAFAALRNKEAIKAGFIGLGAGTLAAYGQENDKFTFYELNPAVISAAQSYFSYLSNSFATIEIIAGDGRVSLHNQLLAGRPQAFDLLVIDAFSGDSIPQHLLTQEAIALYYKHLNANGIIAVHISNSHLELTGLLKGLAEQSGSEWHYFFTKGQGSHQHDTQWFWLTKQVAYSDSSIVKAYKNNDVIANKPAVIWTDNFSSLLSVLK